MAPGSQRKSIRGDVLIYMADRAEKWAWGENSFQDAKRQVTNSICTRRCIMEKELLKSEHHTKGMWFWREGKGSSARVPVWELLQETSGENEVLRGIH